MTTLSRLVASILCERTELILSMEGFAHTLEIISTLLS